MKAGEEMPLTLSILDQSPISAGKTAQDALQASIELAKLADVMGYKRYWIAEHHNMTGLACPTPDVMLGIIGSQTKRIRIGSGAVLLPHYSPFHVAETFNLLATLYPGRIDLGIGRAPGGSAETSIALSGNFLEQVRLMPKKLDELLRFLKQDFPDDHLYKRIQATPLPDTPPVPWLLGTSEKSSIQAAELGLPYAFGHFMSEQDGPSIVSNYQKNFNKEGYHDQPQVIVAVAVICAETTEKAEDLALSQLIWRIQQSKGEGISGVPSVEAAKAYTLTDEEKDKIAKMKEKMIIGNPSEVKKKLKQLSELFQTEELMMITITHCYEDRLRSYELIAKEMMKESLNRNI